MAANGVKPAGERLTLICQAALNIDHQWSEVARKSIVILKCTPNRAINNVRQQLAVNMEHTMSEPARPSLSLTALFAERQARRARDNEAQAQLDRRKEEELSAWKQRLDAFVLTDMHRQMAFDRIKAAFERGETEWMFASFPCSFCTDGGRAIANADVPPINPPTEEEERQLIEEGPGWLATLPLGIKQVFNFWKQELHPGGFGLTARIINFPGGKPGDVGLFFTWSRDTSEG